MLDTLSNTRLADLCFAYSVSKNKINDTVYEKVQLLQTAYSGSERLALTCHVSHSNITFNKYIQLTPTVPG